MKQTIITKAAATTYTISANQQSATMQQPTTKGALLDWIRDNEHKEEHCHAGEVPGLRLGLCPS